MNKSIINIVNRIPNMINELDTECINILLKMKDSKKAIFIQYVGENEISDNDLLDALHNSIRHYRYAGSQVIITCVEDKFEMPEEDSRVKCFDVPLVDVIRQKIMSMKDVGRSKAYPDGIHFVVCGYISKETNKQYHLPFFKPLPKS